MKVKNLIKGKLGKELTTDDGYKAAKKMRLKYSGTS